MVAFSSGKSFVLRRVKEGGQSSACMAGAEHSQARGRQLTNQ